VSHIPNFGNASKSPAGDTASSAGDAASPSGDAVVSHWRCIISFRDEHLAQETPHLPQEMWSHIQIAGYVTLLVISIKDNFKLLHWSKHMAKVFCWYFIQKEN
jgi:hypothetical protein